MIALDTNVLVRFLLNDDPHQSAAARALLAELSADRPGFVCREVVVELSWVLERAYGFSRDRIATVLEELAGTEELRIEAADDVIRSARRLPTRRGGILRPDDRGRSKTGRSRCAPYVRSPGSPASRGRVAGGNTFMTLTGGRRAGRGSAYLSTLGDGMEVDALLELLPPKRDVPVSLDNRRGLVRKRRALARIVSSHSFSPDSPARQRGPRCYPRNRLPRKTPYTYRG